MNRYRKFPAPHFYYTHSNSRKAVLEVAKKYPDIPIKIFVSKADSVDFETMHFKEVSFDNRVELIEYLQYNQYTEANIMDEVT